MKMPQDSVLIKGGTVIDPASNVEGQFDVLIANGVIAEVAPRGEIKRKAAESFDARHLIVAPGFIDLHVHLREPGETHKETIATGTAAAAAGGFTSVCAMPNTAPVNDSVKITEWMQAPERGAIVNVFPIAAATLGSGGEQLTDFVGLLKAGAVGFTDDGKPVLDDAIMREALVQAARLGVPVIQHAEDTRITAGGQLNSGATAFRMGLRGMPPEGESKVVERDVELAKATMSHVHVAHVSTAGALKAIRRGKKDRVRVTCEVTPHHFTLLDEEIRDYDSRYKMNPPLRSGADRDAIWAALEDGTLDAIATDHAPHATHEKQVEFDRAPFGLIGLETALGLSLTVLHRRRGIPLRRVIELLSTNPARILNLRGRGTLAVGAIADVVLFDAKARWTYDSKQTKSRSRNTPFDGWPLYGRVVRTIVSGRTVFRA